MLVCLPKDSAALEPQVERAFSWAAPSTIGPDNVARRFPPSAASRAVADDERRLDELVRAAEADFLALKFDDATARLEACRQDHRPPAAVGASRGGLRARAAAAGPRRPGPRSARAAEAFARAGDAAVEVELDEADYPPAVRQAYKAARAAARARPRRSVELASEPAGAEIEVNGQLAGRTPATLSLPQGRCFLSLTRAGFRPHVAACPGERTTVTLEPAGRDGLRDQLRERIAGDPAWFLEPLLLETLATEESARWIVVLDRDRDSRALKALVYLGGGARAQARRAVAPARGRAGQAVRGGARAGAALAATGGAGGRYADGRARAGGARR